MRLPDVKAKEAAEKAGDRIRRGMAGLSAAYDRIDLRAIVALVFLVVGFILVGAMPLDRQSGTLLWLHQHGVSPRGYGILLAVCGGLILRFPRARYYGVLTLPFLVYVLATVGYVAEGNINPIPAVLYLALYIFMLRAK